jgi:hypothetical protein
MNLMKKRLKQGRNTKVENRSLKTEGTSKKQCNKDEDWDQQEQRLRISSGTG